MNKTVGNETEDWHEYIKLALSEESYSSKVIFCLALLVVFIGSLIGNILTCIVIYYDKAMHTATNCYLFNLAVSDLLITFPILVIIYQVLLEQEEISQYNYGVWSCNFIICVHFFIISILWNNGIMIMTALSIERYIAICFPMILLGTPVWRRVGKVIAMIWTLAIIESVPEFWMINVFNTGESYICYALTTVPARILNGVSALVTFVIPLGIMTFVYTMIAFRVNDNNQMYHLKNTVYNNGYKRKRVNKLITMTVSFVICWLPFFLTRIIVFAVDLKQFQEYRKWWTTAHKVGLFNSSFTTVLNPLLFSIMSTKFRKSLKKLWEGRLINRNLRFENHTLST